jgi:hypothetical protein
MQGAGESSSMREGVVWGNKLKCYFLLLNRKLGCSKCKGSYSVILLGLISNAIISGLLNACVSVVFSDVNEAYNCFISNH